MKSERPLNAIIGLTDTVLRSEMTDSQHQQLSIVGSSSRMLLKIVNDILDLSKLDANKLLIEYQETSISELIDQSVSVVANSAAEKGIKDQGHSRPGYAGHDHCR